MRAAVKKISLDFDKDFGGCEGRMLWIFWLA